MRSLAAAVSVVLAAGCDDTSVPLDSSAPSRLVTRLVTISNAMATMDGLSGFFASESALGASVGIFSPARGVYFSNTADAKASCTPTSCNFSDYFAVYPMQYRFYGNVARAGDQMTIELQASYGHSSSLGTKWVLGGTLTVGESELHGTLNAFVDITTFPPESASTTIRFRHVTFDADGCPIGGSLHA